jgi:hypothetical protein
MHRNRCISQFRPVFLSFVLSSSCILDCALYFQQTQGTRPVKWTLYTDIFRGPESKKGVFKKIIEMSQSLKLKYS